MPDNSLHERTTYLLQKLFMHVVQKRNQ